MELGRWLLEKKQMVANLVLMPIVDVLMKKQPRQRLLNY